MLVHILLSESNNQRHNSNDDSDSEEIEWKKSHSKIKLFNQQEQNKSEMVIDLFLL